MKRKILTIVAGAAGLVAAYFLVSGISHIIYDRPAEATPTESETQTAEQGTEEAKAAMTEDEINEMLEGMKSTGTEETEAVSEEKAVIPVKFEELWQVNPDVYAWITIPGTEIDYPILQHPSDNSYYLMHNIDGSYGYPGCVYTENLNSRDFTDNNTVIYGHNMKNGSMFGMLKKYRADETLYNTSKYFWILTPEKDYRYEIISAYTTSVNSDTYTLFKGPGKEFLEYEKKMLQNSEIKTEAGQEEANVKDKIVTLSTCTGNQATRFVVQGKRVNAVDPQ